MANKTNLNKASAVIELALKKGLNDSDSIWALFHTMSSESKQVKDIVIQNPKVPELNLFSTDIACYDKLLKGGV
jgi:hypothetical protein